MRFGAGVPIGILVVALAAAGCSGSSPSQPPADLPATVAGRAAVSGGAGGPAPGVARGAHRLGGVRRAVSECTGSGSGSFIGANNSNVADGVDSGVLSGQYNDACDYGSGIVAGEDNIINSSGSYNLEFIGGGSGNAITGGSGTFIGGGNVNTISGSGPDLAFIGGGAQNTISAGVYLQGAYAFIGGGYKNAVSNSYGVVAGGATNTVSGQLAVVGGGLSNKALANYATIPGGDANEASGLNSLAAGTKAWAATSGAFVWSDDSGGTQLKSSANNQFLAKASGGVKFFSNATLTTGVSLAAGGGSWASLSDRAVKTNVESVNDGVMLDKVASLPITQWSYISERGVRHVGPMAQDFYAAFGVGEDNKHITSVDEDGVALAAIKALHQQVAELRAEVRELKREMAIHVR